MKYYSNEAVTRCLAENPSIDVLRQAYQELHRGGAAIQPRSRIGVPAAKFSTMAAIISSLGIAAVKMYTTINSHFKFHVALYSIEDGRLLAVIEADALTRFRTAATTVLAANHLARPNAKTLGLFGSGIQATAHAELLLSSLAIEEVHITGTGKEAELASKLHQHYGVRVDVSDAATAAACDIVVLATRATSPVIKGEWLSEGCFVAGIGSTRPDCRELDDVSIERAAQIVVDWKEQTLREAGDFLLLPEGCLEKKCVVDLSSVIGEDRHRQADCKDIVVYKAVGMALQDAAVASLVYQKACATYST